MAAVEYDEFSGWEVGADALLVDAGGWFDEFHCELGAGVVVEVGAALWVVGEDFAGDVLAGGFSPGDEGAAGYFDVFPVVCGPCVFVLSSVFRVMNS